MAAEASYPSDPGSTASSLIQAIKEEDPQGWERLVRLYSPLIYSWCRRSELTAQDAADVMQQVLLSVHRRIGSFHKRLPRRSFRAWMKKITANKIRNLARQNARCVATATGGSDAQILLHQIAAPSSTSGSWAKSARSAARGELLKQTLASVASEFEPRTWQAFWRTTIDDQLPADVAFELGMSMGAVRTAKWRVLKRLKEYLQGVM